MSFKDDTHRLRLTDYCLLKVNLEDYNVMTDWRNFFDQPINDDIKNISILQKIVPVKEMIAQLIPHLTIFTLKKTIRWLQYIYIYICKEQVLGVNPRTIQQINFTVNQDQTGQAFCFSFMSK